MAVFGRFLGSKMVIFDDFLTLFLCFYVLFYEKNSFFSSKFSFFKNFNRVLIIEESVKN